MSDVISVRLYLSGVRVLEVEVDAVGRLERWRWNQLGSDRGAGIAGSGAIGCGTDAPRGFVTRG